MSMNNLAFGLSQVGRGITQGGLRGMMINEDRQRQARKDTLEERRLGLEGRRVGLEEKQLGEQHKVNLWKGMGESLELALTLGKQTGDWDKAAEVGNTFYSKLTGEKGGWLNGLKYDPPQDLMTVDLGDQMLIMPSKVSAQVADLMKRAPEKAEEALQMLVKTGAGVVMPKGASPDVLARAGAKDSPKVSGRDAPKVSEYVAGIKAVADKWKFDPGAFTNEDGSLNLEAFLGSKETAYAIMERKAGEGVPGAREDLSRVKEYYEGIDRLLRPQNPGAAGDKAEDPLGLGI